jgi:hypothetical protein
MFMNDKMPLPEVFPRVYFDIDHGEYFDEIDIDFAAITKQLRDGGVSDEAISELEVRFRTTRFDGKKESRQGRIVMGKYFCDAGDMSWLSRVITRQQEHIEVSTPAIFEMLQSSGSGLPKSFRELTTNSAYSRTLAHELDHAVAARDFDQQAANSVYERDGKYMRRFFRYMPYGAVAIANSLSLYSWFTKREVPSFVDNSLYRSAAIVAICIGGIKRALDIQGEHERYLNHPGEIRARAAEEVTSKDLVVVNLKE